MRTASVVNGFMKFGGHPAEFLLHFTNLSDPLFLSGGLISIAQVGLGEGFLVSTRP